MEESRRCIWSQKDFSPPRQVGARYRHRYRSGLLLTILHGVPATSCITSIANCRSTEHRINFDFDRVFNPLWNVSVSSVQNDVVIVDLRGLEYFRHTMDYHLKVLTNYNIYIYSFYLQLFSTKTTNSQPTISSTPFVFTIKSLSNLCQLQLDDGRYRPPPSRWRSFLKSLGGEGQQCSYQPHKW